MAYNLTLTNGNPLITVNDGTTDNTATSITLIGKNFAGYGTAFNENFVSLLENFSNNTAPPNPLVGQLWWDSVDQVLNICTSKNPIVWKTIKLSSASSTDPALTSTPMIGDFWFDTTHQVLNVWTGSSWLSIGPGNSGTSSGTGSATPAAVVDNGNSTHQVLLFAAGNKVVGVISGESTPFTLSSTNVANTALLNAGFSAIYPGMNLTSQNSSQYWGTSNVASSLMVSGSPVSGANFVQTNTTGDLILTGTGKIQVQNTGGFKVGANGEYSVTIDNTNSSVSLMSTRAGYSLDLFVAPGGVPTKSLTITSAGVVQLAASPTGSSPDLAVATVGYVKSVSAGGVTLDGNTPITGVLYPFSVYDLGTSAKPFGTIYGSQFSGTATNANNVMVNGTAVSGNNLVLSTGYTSQLTTSSASGLLIGPSGNGQFSITSSTSPNMINLTSITSGFGVKLAINNGGSTIWSVDPTTSLMSMGATPGDSNTNAVATVGYVLGKISGLGGGFNPASSPSVIPSADITYNLGSSSYRWTNVYAQTFVGQASSALYADLAERFEADQSYVPGTVVQLGGPAEITAAMDELSDDVFGVISTQAAYLMNAGAGDNITHPPVAVQGRVPVRVVGSVKKGDRLVSAGNGLARAASRSEITSFNVIGRALQDKTTTDEGTIEAIVRLNS
jgi:hypothetical protein